jgi:hypothetical protein
VKNDLIETNQENPKGFWERKDVRKLNDKLLHQMGCDWSEISTLYQEEIPENVLVDFNSEASSILDTLKQETLSGVIGLKEPRLCIL